LAKLIEADELMVDLGLAGAVEVPAKKKP